MYKYLIIILILALCNCQKQTKITDEEDPASIITSEKPFQESNIEIDSAVNKENNIQKDIIGTWLMTAPSFSLELEFKNNGILYIREFDFGHNFVDEKFYPYNIEGHNLIINDTGKSNNFGNFANDYLFTSENSISIKELDTKKLVLSLGGSDFPFYKRTMEDALESLNNRLSYENKLKEFIYIEMLNSIIFQGDTNDVNGVINTYGKPIKDEIIEHSDGFRYEGGMTLTGIREITYEDLMHRYYIFINRNNIERQFYMDVTVNKKLDRLKMINIGVTFEEIMAVFGSNYWRKDGEDIIYFWDDDDGYKWVRFYIKNNNVDKISYIITSWE
jgi:hypothetical protein